MSQLSFFEKPKYDSENKKRIDDYVKDMHEVIFEHSPEEMTRNSFWSKAFWKKYNV